jgi:DNA-binding MarR family transcriptional regulator
MCTMHETREMHHLLMQLVGILSHPQPDQRILQRAGVTLDRALFPLMVRLAVYSPIGVVELANLVDRDHSTISRQLTTLERMGLVKREKDPANRRFTLAKLTEEGERMRASIDAARASLFNEIQKAWTDSDRYELNRLLQRLVQEMRDVLVK